MIRPSFLIATFLTIALVGCGGETKSEVPDAGPTDGSTPDGAQPDAAQPDAGDAATQEDSGAEPDDSGVEPEDSGVEPEDSGVEPTDGGVEPEPGLVCPDTLPDHGTATAAEAATVRCSTNWPICVGTEPAADCVDSHTAYFESQNLSAAQFGRLKACLEAVTVAAECEAMNDCAAIAVGCE